MAAACAFHPVFSETCVVLRLLSSSSHLRLWKVDVQIRKGTKIQKWPHGTTGEGVLYAFIFSCMNWAQSPLTQSLSCLGKVGVPPPHFAMPCPEEIGRYEIRTLEILALYTAPVYRYRSASPSEVRQVTIMGGSLCYIEMGADLRGT